MTLDFPLEDQEVFRDAFNGDEAVLTYTAPRFYHYVLNGNDVIFDTQALGTPPYAVSPGLTFEAFLLDNEIPMAASRALILGIPINRIEANPEQIGKIVEWLDANDGVTRVGQKTRR